MDIVVSILSTESITVTGPNHTVIDRIVYRPGQPGCRHYGIRGGHPCGGYGRQQVNQ